MALTHSRHRRGAYSPTEFQFAAPEWDALEMLPVLDALAVCAQCQSDGAILLRCLWEAL